MVNCVTCSTPVSRNRPGISCEGCKREFHTLCITKTEDLSLIKLLNTIPGLYWKCERCIENCLLVDAVGLQRVVETRISEALSPLTNEFNALKLEIAKATTVESKPATHQLSRYADVLKDKSQSAVIIYPKDSNQPLNITKSDILSNINPTVENLQISKVKSVKDGGILIGCKTEADNVKLKEMVQQKMDNFYEVKNVAGFRPRLRVVGMTENFSSDDVSNYLLKCNPGIFVNDSGFKILKIFPTKKNESIWQMVIEVEKLTYDRALKAGNVFVGYDSCTVYDAVEIFRCFKCNEYNHSSKNCKKTVSCPVCSENHELKECQSRKKKCSNCCNLKIKKKRI